MAKACYCHVEGHKHREREAQKTTRYHEHRCECVCGCNQDTLGYGYCPYCHFEHAKLRGQTLGILALPEGEAPRPAWWKP